MKGSKVRDDGGSRRECTQLNTSQLARTYTLITLCFNNAGQTPATGRAQWSCSLVKSDFQFSRSYDGGTIHETSLGRVRV